MSVLNFFHLIDRSVELRFLIYILIDVCMCVCVLAFVQEAARSAGAFFALIQALETHKEKPAVLVPIFEAFCCLAAINPVNQVPTAP